MSVPRIDGAIRKLKSANRTPAVAARSCRRAAEQQKVALELARDETILSAAEMEHGDDDAVRSHGAAVAKTTDRTVATKTSDRMPRPEMTVALAIDCRREAHER